MYNKKMLQIKIYLKYKKNIKTGYLCKWYKWKIIILTKISVLLMYNFVLQMSVPITEASNNISTNIDVSSTEGK